MPRQRPDVNEQYEEAVAQAAEESMAEALPKVGRPRGKKTKFTVVALKRIFGMSPEDLARYTPKNGYEEGAIALRNLLGKKNTQSVPAWKAVAETLGERVGTNWKKTLDETEDHPAIVNDLPTAARKQ